MAVISENLENNLIRHYSDSGKYIRQIETQIEYVDAIDAIPCPFTYEEVDKDIDEEEA